MKLSIIVPVYGVENYIFEFAESLLSQLNNEVELIIVNDGTKDRSIEIIKTYINEKNFSDKNIVFLEQENQGQSIARNHGISLAKGDYITFLDPDDYVISDYILRILESLKSDPSMVQFNAQVVKNKGAITEKLHTISLVDNNDLIQVTEKEIFKIYSKRAWFSWLRVIRRDYLSENFYPENVNYQDMMAFPEIYKKIKNIKNINENLVFYRVHNQSSVNSFKPKLLKSADYGIKLYNNKNDKYNLIIYKQFIDLKLNLILDSSGLISAMKWYFLKIFKSRDQVLYHLFGAALIFLFKISARYMYRKFKSIFFKVK